MKLYKERADRLLKRRQEDVKDQSLEYMPGILHSTFVIKTHNNSTNSSAVSVVWIAISYHSLYSQVW